MAIQHNEAIDGMEKQGCKTVNTFSKYFKKNIREDYMGTNIPYNPDSDNGNFGIFVGSGL